MTGDRRPRQPLPIILGPAKVSQSRCHHQRRIGDATGYHDLRAHTEGFGNGRSSQIDIGTDYVAFSKAGIEIRLQDRLARRIRKIIAFDYCHT